MSNRYLTHLGSVLFLHLILLLGGLKIWRDQELKSSLTYAPSVIKLKLAGQVLLAPSEPQVKTTAKPATPKLQKEIVSTPVERPAEHPTIATTLSQSAKVDQKANFKAQLRAEIEKNKYYPPVSRRLGQTGTVVVAFTLLEDGHIIDVRLDSPSRFERLNESAMEAVKKVHKFRPIPKEWGEDRLDIKVPLNFVTI